MSLGRAEAILELVAPEMEKGSGPLSSSLLPASELFTGREMNHLPFLEHSTDGAQGGGLQFRMVFPTY